MKAPKAQNPYRVSEFSNLYVYIKYEADRYIAHINRKRCEAMANKCERDFLYYKLRRQVEASYILADPSKIQKIENKTWIAAQHRAKWLSLAEHYRKLEKA